MQELQGDVAVVLRDLVDFLECLSDVELSEKLQTTRESLLARSRAALQQQQQIQIPDSPEVYLDMNAGKSMLQISLDEAEQPQEYVGADEQQGQRGSLQHYYETFQDFQVDGSKAKADGKTKNDDGMDDVVLLYASFSATQAKARSAKSGSLLHLKRERKMFAPFNVFWLDKWCWVSLVGSHLLLYANERESRPYLVVPLRGYKSRPAPGVLARDPRRSEAAFEIYCPGDRTFQFVAKNAQEMKEWVDAISDSIGPENGDRSKTRAATFVEILELEMNERMCIERIKEEQEKYQDVINSPKLLQSKVKDKQPVVKSSTPEKEKVEQIKEETPPLPARTRRLPSLPSQDKVPFVPKEEFYDEEGLYHKIEDVKAQREYQNCQVQSGQKGGDKKLSPTVDLVQETYDDVEAINERARMERAKEPVETYDDVQSIVKDKRNDEPISYDDIQTVSENLRAKAENEKSPKISKSPTKRSFLDRVCNRKESMKKDNKKAKSPTPSIPAAPVIQLPTPSNTEQELPCYDDISNLMNRENCASPSITEENYLTPPPPRPIYSRPPTIIKHAVPSEEIYDDIGSYLEINGNGCKDCTNVDVIKDYPKNGNVLSDLQLSIDQEHYQVPKSNNKVAEHQEELYDEVALSEAFKNRQRESVSTSSEKSVWSRFGSGKRPHIFDHVTKQTSCNESAETTDDNSSDQQNAKVKSFQKFITKMEKTLGKTNKANGLAQN